MIEVIKFCVKHNGVYYGPGQEAGNIIEGLSRSEEKALIAKNPGIIERVEEPKPKTEAPKPSKQQNDSGKQSVTANINFNPDEVIKGG